jgi:hypothetical protein
VRRGADAAQGGVVTLRVGRGDALAKPGSGLSRRARPRRARRWVSAVAGLRQAGLGRCFRCGPALAPKLLASAASRALVRGPAVSPAAAVTPRQGILYHIAFCVRDGTELQAAMYCILI